MSSHRAVTVAFTVLSLLPSGTLFARETADPQLQAPPRDPRPDVPRPESSREAEIRRLMSIGAANTGLWIELAKLQEDRGAHKEAEQTLTHALAASGRERGVLQAVANYYNRLAE